MADDEALAKRDEQQLAKKEKKETALTGSKKAALWLLSVEEDLAVETLKHLDEADVQKLAALVKDLQTTSPKQIEVVHREFSKKIGEHQMTVHGSIDYLNQLAIRAFGQRASKIVFDLEGNKESGPRLSQADNEVLIPLLRQENPQVIAAVVANLGLERGGEILASLPESSQMDVISRISRLKKIPREALQRAEKVLAAGLPDGNQTEEEVDGIRSAASLLNQLEPDDAEYILSTMAENEADIATNIRQAMFTFADLAALDRRGFQALLKEVQSDQLLTALRTASEDIKEKVFTSLSKRAGEMLKDDLAVMGPVRLADVEEAQQAIVSVALRLRSEGKISLGGSEDMV